MALIVTPGQLSRRSGLYHQLGSTIAAGLPMLQALEMLSQTAHSRSVRPQLLQIISRIQAGSTFSEGAAATGKWLPEFDLALLAAGEKSGRLDGCLRLLSEHYEERARLARVIISNLGYPVFVFHFAIIIFPPVMLKLLIFDGKIFPFLVSKLAILLPIYAAVFALVYATQGRHGVHWRARIEWLLGRVPILGSARRNLALARLSAALEGLISAGVSIVEAWDLAVASSGSPALMRSVASWKAHVIMGMTPSEAVRRSGVFPDMFTALYSSGEVSGKLEESLGRLYKHFRDEGSRQLQIVAQWTPRIVYFGIMLAIAYQVLSFYSNYYGEMMKNF